MRTVNSQSVDPRFDPKSHTIYFIYIHINAIFYKKMIEESKIAKELTCDYNTF